MEKNIKYKFVFFMLYKINNIIYTTIYTFHRDITTEQNINNFKFSIVFRF